MRRVIPLLLAFALMAAACGDDDAGVTTTTAAATTNPQATTQASTTTTAASSGAPADTTTSAAAATTTLPRPDRAPCNHPYMPVLAGSAWTFETATGETITWEVTSVAADGSSAVMAAEVLSGETGEEIVPIEVNLMCGDFGMQAPELAFTGAFPFEVAVTQVVEEGVFLPPAEEMVPGAMWMSLVNITAELQDASSLQVEIRREATFTVVGEEEVTVPAGTFTALRVDSEFTQEISMGGTPITPFTGAQTQWFVDGLGLVLESGPSGETEFDLRLVESTVSG